MSERILERPAGDKEFEPTPADGSAPSVNPPPFRWLVHEGVQRWKVELTGPGGKRFEFGPLRASILAMPRRLPAGEWRWQYVGLDGAGRQVGRGRERTFTVNRGLGGFVSPDVCRLERAWRDRRPRLFAGRIAALRQRCEGEFADAARQLAEWCRLAENEPLIDEPADFRPFPSDTEEHNADWVRIYSAGKVGSAHAVRFALSFLLTGNERHLTQAKRWAMRLLSFNPFGVTSLQTNDEAGMPMLERLGLVYDWLHPYWTDAERERFFQVMLVRGEEARERDRGVDFAARPFFNHQCRTIAFTGLASVAFLGEIPQAAEWLKYVLDVLAVSYPSGSWGGDDGGWSQGLSYWSAYMSFLMEFVVAAGELDIGFAAAPYYRNTGYFAIYNLPPYAPRGGFGDHGEHEPGFAHKLVVGGFGTLVGDGYFRDYAERIPAPLTPPEKLLADPAVPDPSRRWDAWQMPEVMHLLLMPQGDLPRRDIAELPPARQFPYIGWAAMHSRLGDAERDAWLQLKSGPFGSVSHSHADQNAFNLFAYGRMLLIDSGYYPWYGSPHDALWTRQSWAHNMVLVGGRGQPPFDWFARGRIEAFATSLAGQKGRGEGRSGSPPFAYARGEAADAYNRPPSRAALALAEKHFPDLIERMGPATQVRRASRSVLMVGGDAPWFVVLDWLQTADPVKFQWLAHATERMAVAGDGGGFAVTADPAALAVRFAWPTQLAISQDDRFTVPPEGRAKGSPNQWHLQAETAEPATTARFLTVLAPHRADGAPPAIEPLATDTAIGARVGESVVLAPRSGAIGPLAWGGIEADAAAVVVADGTLFAAEAARIDVAGKTLVDSPDRQTVTRRAPRKWSGS